MSEEIGKNEEIFANQISWVRQVIGNNINSHFYKNDFLVDFSEQVNELSSSAFVLPNA